MAARQATAEDSIARVIRGWRAARPDLDVEAVAVTARLERLRSHIAPRLDAVFAEFGLRSADFALLATLVRLDRERISQRRIGRELGLSAGTISVRLDRLATRGLVRRDPDPADGRGTLVALTSAGRELFEACAPVHLANARRLLSALDDGEREQLGELLGKLLAAFER